MLTRTVSLRKNANESIDIPNLSNRYMVPSSITFDISDIDDNTGDFEATISFEQKKKMFSSAYFFSNNIVNLDCFDELSKGVMLLTNMHTKQISVTFHIKYVKSSGRIIYQRGRMKPEDQVEFARDENDNVIHLSNEEKAEVERRMKPIFAEILKELASKIKNTLLSEDNHVL